MTRVTFPEIAWRQLNRNQFEMFTRVDDKYVTLQVVRRRKDKRWWVKAPDHFVCSGETVQEAMALARAIVMLEK